MTVQNAHLPSHLDFQGVSLRVIDHEGRPWLTAADLARALGYSRADKVTQIYERHKDEFTEEMTTTLKMRVVREGRGEVDMDVRIFSPRGCYLIAMFARTPVAKAFRKWVLDVLEKLEREGRVELKRHPTGDLQALDERLKAFLDQLEARMDERLQPVREKLEKHDHLIGCVLGRETRLEKKLAEVIGLLEVKRSQAKEGDLREEKSTLPEVEKAEGDLEEPISASQYRRLSEKVDLIARQFGYTEAARWAVWCSIRHVFGIPQAKRLPASRYEDALRFLGRCLEETERFRILIGEVEKRFLRDYFRGSGVDWQELNQRLEEETEKLLSCLRQERRCGLQMRLPSPNEDQDP